VTEFREAAERLAGTAGVLLGWRPGEFWSSTPAELSTVFHALAGDREGVSTTDIERLMRMFPDG
jgi:hypothetical protein